MSQPAVHNPYLGSRISLISKAKIRYEGILYAIDTDAMTVALTKVRSFGTENRCPDRPIGPRDETFEYIIFRGTDICDLNVCDLPNDRFPQDPAILSATTQPPAPIGQQANGYMQPAQNFPQAQSPKHQVPVDVDEKERHESNSERDRRNNIRNTQNYDNRRNNQTNQRNSFQNRNNIKGGSKPNPTAQFKEDFDFESANAEFETIRKELFENLKISPDKEEAKNDEEEVESGEIIEEPDSKDVPKEYYNKANSFFDNISCEATDPHGERITRSAERKLNSETFGITGNNRNYIRRGVYNKRGGGDRNGYNNRGFRGGYRGRGGYNRNDNSGDNRNWRQGHDNRGMENSRGNWKRGNWNHTTNNRNNSRSENNWRSGNRSGNRWQNKSQRNDNEPRQNRNRNREWVDYEYDVSKARQETQQEA